MATLLNDNLQAELAERAAKDPEFASQLRENPKATLSAFLSLELPENLEVSIHQESRDALHIVLPALENQSPEILELTEDIAVAGCSWGANCKGSVG
ncbi:MAG: nitrile hydratase [Moorea sp. SIO4E2]|uniref:hypothetical protein n=1 Tax=Moorena sp. SIO4E2 TaxID=2607826 RepID=UPI0013BAF65A|nr:hypothetical protein [Moorena sp. SIO4E2]NEQ07046.1 nitrile hydratase [Moorena sp. SIO4E2]